MACINLTIPPCPPIHPISPELGFAPILLLSPDKSWIEISFFQVCLLAKRFDYNDAMLLLRKIDEVNDNLRQSNNSFYTLYKDQLINARSDDRIRYLKMRLLELAILGLIDFKFTVPGYNHTFHISNQYQIDSKEFSVTFDLDCK